MSKANIYALLSPLSPAPGGLIWGDQNGPRPAKPYAVVTIRTLDPFRPVHKDVSESGTVQLLQIVRLSIEWRFIGLNAFDLAGAAQLKLRNETSADRAANLGLGISNVSNVTSIPTVLNTSQVEDASLIEMVVYDSVSDTDLVGLIDVVEITGEIDGKPTCDVTVERVS